MVFSIGLFVANKNSFRRTCMSRIFAVFILASLWVTACSALIPEPTPTPTNTATPIPTSTPMPTATATLTPTNTPKPPTETPNVVSLLLPTGTPAKEWKGIPIMPGAISGSGDDGLYRFTTHASSEEIQKFYEDELEKFGATLIGVGEGTEKKTVIMFYTKNNMNISVSIIPQGDIMLVLIVE
jgi:hypothetical protein